MTNIQDEKDRIDSEARIKKEEAEAANQYLRDLVQ